MWRLHNEYHVRIPGKPPDSTPDIQLSHEAYLLPGDIPTHNNSVKPKPDLLFILTLGIHISKGIIDDYACWVPVVIAINLYTNCAGTLLDILSSLIWLYLIENMLFVEVPEQRLRIKHKDR